MFTTLITHAKTIALAGTLTCGGAYGAHTLYTHNQDHRLPQQRFADTNHRFDRDDRNNHGGPDNDRRFNADRFDQHRDYSNNPRHDRR